MLVIASPLRTMPPQTLAGAVTWGAKLNWAWGPTWLPVSVLRTAPPGLVVLQAIGSGIVSTVQKMLEAESNP